MVRTTKYLLTAPLLVAGLAWTPAVQAADELDPHDRQTQATARLDPSPGVLAAREDLGRRVNLAPEQIELSHLERRSWPDSSLGVSQQGQVVAHTPTEGERVTFWANGRPYIYHTAGDQFIAYPDYDPEMVTFDTLEDPNYDWQHDRLVQLEGQLYPYDEGWRLSSRATLSPNGTWTAGDEMAVNLDGQGLDTYRTHYHWTEPTPVRVYGYFEPEAADGMHGVQVVRVEPLGEDRVAAEMRHGVMRNGQLYVPLRAAAQAADLRLVYVPTKNAVDIYDTVDRAGSELIARIRTGERKFHSGKAIPNGNIPMDGAPLMIGGQMYVPASFINRIVQSPMVGDPAEGAFQVHTNTYDSTWQILPDNR